MLFGEEDYEALKKALPAKAICESCGGEMLFVDKARDDHRIFFYLCQNPECANSTEPYLLTLIF